MPPSTFYLAFKFILNIVHKNHRHLFFVFEILKKCHWVEQTNKWFYSNLIEYRNIARELQAYKWIIITKTKLFCTKFAIGDRSYTLQLIMRSWVWIQPDADKNMEKIAKKKR
jgi:hypothetical protein